MGKRSAKELREEELLDMREVMAGERGRRVIRRLLAAAGIWKSVMRNRRNVMPEERVVFNGAQRDLGQFVLDEAQMASPDMFERMNSEAAARRLLEGLAAEDEKETEDE